MKKLALFSLCLLLLSACARRINVSYQASSTNTGTIKLVPAKKTTKTTVTINDSLVVEKKKVKSVTIKNLPPGEYKVQYSADNSSYKYSLDTTFTITVEPPKTITKTVKVPPYSAGYYIYSGIGLLVGVIVLLSL